MHMAPAFHQGEPGPYACALGGAGETMRGMHLSQLISGARPRTLALGVAPVWIGAAGAWALMRGREHTLPQCAWVAGGAHCASSPARMTTLMLLCLGVAVFLQIAANFANDYSDGIRGTDAHRAAAAVANRVEYVTRATGPGDVEREETLDYEELHAPTRLVASGVPPRAVLTAAAVNAALACACGLAAVVITGYWWLLAVGALCVLAGWFYVGGAHPYGYRGWGEVAAFVFFGPVATLGTTVTMAGAVDWPTAYASVVIGLVALAVLSVNNLRDIRSDAQAGKRTWAVRLGARATTVCIIVVIALVMLAVLAAGVYVGVHGSTLAHLTAGWGFCAVLGMVCVLLTGYFTCFEVARGEYMRAMWSLALLALWFALAFTGFAMVL